MVTKYFFSQLFTDINHLKLFKKLKQENNFGQLSLMV